MKSNEYSLIVILPPLLITYVPLITVWVMILFYRARLELITRWIATNAFSEIFKEKKKTSSPRETRWLFKGIDLTAEKKTLSKTLASFLNLFIVMFGAVLMMFWQLLLLEISNSCDEDDQTKDCFEYKLWSSKPAQDPINCSSAAVKNGTIQVVCYKIVFKFGVASGASYGAFKLSMFAVTVGTSAMLMVKKPKIILAIRVIFGLLFFGALVSVIVVMSVLPSGFAFMSDNWVTILQTITVAVIVFGFLFVIPWKELIAIKAARDNQEDYGLENPAADTDAN